LRFASQVLDEVDLLILPSVVNFGIFGKVLQVGYSAGIIQAV
jgi:hypothetical protein